MPHVAISMIPGRDDDAKKTLALKVQKYLCQELGIDQSFVSVSIEDIPTERWEEFMKKFPDRILFAAPGCE